MTASAQADKQFASTLARGLELLGCFTPEQPVLGNKDFVARTGLDKATVSRLTYTLEHLGYLCHDGSTGKYRLGASVLSMAYPLLASMNLRQTIRPLIREMAEEVGGMVGLSVRDRANMVYMEATRAERDTAPPIDIGLSFPIVTSATGYAWLARVSAAEREKAMNLIKVYYPQLHAQRLATVRQAVSEFGKRGYCASPGSLQPDRLAVAVPVTRPVNAEILVFTCAVAIGGRQVPELRAQLGERLVTLVRNVEVALGLD